MKKGLLVVVASVILLTIPALSSAQGLLPAGTPGFFGSGTPYYAPGGRAFLDPLSLYVGWGDTSPGQVTFYFDGQQLGGGISGLAHRWDVRGIWLGLHEKANFSENSAVAVEAWWLIPTGAQGLETAALTQNISNTPPTVILITTPTGTNWDARSDWWFLDGRFLFTPYPSNAMLFAGFRYDHFSTRFESSSGGPGIFAGTADVTVNSYIPYIGGEYRSRASGGGGLLFRILGFPWVPASVQHNQTIAGGSRAETTANFTNRGYFFEVFGEYDWLVGGSAGIGAFARWSVLQGRGASNTDVTPTGISASDNINFYRNHVTIGGKVSLGFALPY